MLFRTSNHSGPLEIIRRDVPFVKFGGLKFLDAANVKDVLAMLRFVETVIATPTPRARGSYRTPFFHCLNCDRGR